jgi:hypothetical protein
MVKNVEWTKMNRVQGDGAGLRAYIKGEFVVRALIASKINPAAQELEMLVEEVYGDPVKPQAWIIIRIREIKKAEDEKVGV